MYCRVALPGWSADSLWVGSLWYSTVWNHTDCAVRECQPVLYSPYQDWFSALEYSISYLCTYDLYSPVHNVLDACITAYPSGGGGGPWKSRVFLALWNGIEPVGECHLGQWDVVVSSCRGCGSIFPNLSSNYDFTSKFDFLVLISVGSGVINCFWALHKISYCRLESY